MCLNFFVMWRVGSRLPNYTCLSFSCSRKQYCRTLGATKQAANSNPKTNIGLHYTLPNMGFGRCPSALQHQSSSYVCFAPNVHPHRVGTTQSCHLSNPKPGHTTGGSRQGGAARGGAGRRRGGTPAGLFAQETTDPPALQGIEDNCPGLLFGNTNKRSPM